MNEQLRKKTRKEIVDMLSNLDTYTIDDVEYKILSKNDAWLLVFKGYPYNIYAIDYKHHNILGTIPKDIYHIKRKRSDSIFLINMIEYEAWCDHDQIDRVIDKNKKQTQVGEMEPEMPVRPEYHVNMPLVNKDDIIEIYGLKYHTLSKDQEKFIRTNICASDIAKSRYSVYWYHRNDEGIYTISNITTMNDEDLSIVKNNHIGGYAVLAEQYEKFWFSYNLYTERARLDKEREEVYEEYRAKREAIFEDLKSDKSIKGKFSNQDLNAIARYIQILNEEEEEDVEETEELREWNDYNAAIMKPYHYKSSCITTTFDNDLKEYVDNKIKENLNSEISENAEECNEEEDTNKHLVFAEILNIIPENMIKRCFGVKDIHISDNNNNEYFLILRADSRIYRFINTTSIDDKEKCFECSGIYITDPSGIISQTDPDDIILYKVRIPDMDKNMVYDINDLLVKGLFVYVNVSPTRLASSTRIAESVIMANNDIDYSNEHIRYADIYGEPEYENGIQILGEDNIHDILDDVELGVIYPMDGIPLRRNTKIFIKTSYGTFINGNGTEFTPSDLLN